MIGGMGHTAMVSLGVSIFSKKKCIVSMEMVLY